MSAKKSVPCTDCGCLCSSSAEVPRCLACYLDTRRCQSTVSEHAPSPAETLSGSRASDEAVVDALWPIWGNRSELPALLLAKISPSRALRGRRMATGR